MNAQNEKEIRDAYVWIRQNNTSIPDWVLDLMKNAALEYDKLKASNNELLKIAKHTAFIFDNEANYPEGTIGYGLAQSAKEAIKNATK